MRQESEAGVMQESEAAGIEAVAGEDEGPLRGSPPPHPHAPPGVSTTPNPTPYEAQTGYVAGLKIMTV